MEKKDLDSSRSFTIIKKQRTLPAPIFPARMILFELAEAVQGFFGQHTYPHYVRFVRNRDVRL